MITLDTIQLNNAKIEKINIHQLIGAEGKTMSVSIAVASEGFSKMYSFIIEGEEYNDFWAIYDSGNALLALIKEKTGLVFDTNEETEKMFVNDIPAPEPDPVVEEEVQVEEVQEGSEGEESAVEGV